MFGKKVGDSSGLVPLSEVKSGQEVVLTEFAGGRGFYHQVASMGLNLHRKVKVLSGSGGDRGAVLISCGESRIAVGRGMAHKIRVKLCG